MALWVCLALASGCGDDNSQRVAVSGIVRLDSRPLDDAAIMFIPPPGTAGPKAAAPIRDGRFALDAAEGPAIGRLRVEIWETDPSIAPGENRPAKYPAARIPDSYNRQSTLFVETDKRQTNEFSFELITANPQPRR